MGNGVEQKTAWVTGLHQYSCVNNPEKSLLGSENFPSNLRLWEIILKLVKVKSVMWLSNNCFKAELQHLLLACSTKCILPNIRINMNWISF